MYAVLPDQVNEAHQVINSMLPEDMKIVLAEVAFTVSVIRDIQRDAKQGEAAPDSG